MILRTSMSLLSLCFLFGCTTTGSSEEGLSMRIKSYQSQIIEDEVTGSNLVIVGAADGTRAMSVVNSGRPGDRDVDESTVFPIWSMSKPITIVAMMTLHEQGKFEWNDPVADYIPCFADLVVQDGDAIRPATEPLRIEHLMAHRSGWAYYSGWEDGVPNTNSIKNPVPRAMTGPIPTRPGSTICSPTVKPLHRSHWPSNLAHRSCTGSTKPFWGDWSRFFLVFLFRIT